MRPSAIVVALALLLPTGARAQDAPDAGLGAESDEASQAEARRLFLEGRAALDAGLNAEAADRFRASFELHPHLPTAFNAAFALREAGRPTEALAWLARIAGGELDALTPEQAAELEVFRAETTARLGRIVIRIEGADAADVVVDGEPSGRVLRGSELARNVDPGEHGVTARAEGLPELHADATVAAGGTVTVPLRFERPAAPAIAPAPPREPSDPAPSPPPARAIDEEAGGISPWVWIVAAVVAVGAGVAVTLSLTADDPDGDGTLGTVAVLRFP